MYVSKTNHLSAKHLDIGVTHGNSEYMLFLVDGYACISVLG